MHVLPPVPQPVVAFSLAVATQALPLQHPAHPDDVLHTHAPALQVVPVAHGLHMAPFTPHVALLDVWHLPDESQQPEHDEESQTHCPVLLQCCPWAHGPHMPPPVPQLPAVSLAYGTHVFPLQQPLGHELAVHVHTPEELQDCVDAHGAHAIPPLPQVASLEVWQTPFESQQPF
jgi:hypothetical protein